MKPEEKEQTLLKAAALQNARSILFAQKRAESELLQAKDALVHKTEELIQEREWFKVTLSSIGEAVITTDTESRVTFLNPVAEAMTGWKAREAIGQPLQNIFKVINEQTRQPADDPIRRALEDGLVVVLAEQTLLISRHSKETPIANSAAPIRDALDRISGAVMVFHDVTERRRAEEALRRSENRKAAILNAALDAIITMDHKGRVVDFNPAAETIFGYRGEDAAGKRLADLILPKRFRKKHDKGLAHYLATGTGPIYGKRIEMPALHADGREFPMELSISVIAGINPPMFTATLRDITQRKKSEQALQESEQKLRATFEQAAVGIGIAQLDGRLEQVNERFAEILGYSREELCSRTVLGLTHPDDLAATQEHIHRLLAGEISNYVMEKRYLRKDGGEVFSRTTVTFLKDATGRPERFIGVIEDITEHKKVEEAVRRSEEELRAMADSIPQLAWMANAHGEVFWYNRGWFEYTGTTLAEMTGSGWEKVHDPKILPQVVERWKYSTDTGQPFEMEFPLRGADGVFRWFLSRMNPVCDGEGQVVRWFGTNTNVDEVRRAKETLQDETRILELLNTTGTAIASQLDLQTIVQIVTDAATKLSGAKFGAFFYNVINQEGESFLLYTLSGAPREAFAKFGIPRNTPIFNPTFKGEGVIRSSDITKDPRYGTMSPHGGMPKGHLPVCSYLAVPVVSRSGEVIGGLFFGHPEPNVFTERSERLVVGVAAQAAIAIDNARLYEAAQKEIAERKSAEAALRESEQRFRAVADVAPVLIWVSGIDKLCNYFNKAWLEFVGHAMEEELGNGWAKNVHPEDLGRCLDVYNNAFDGRQTFEMEYRIQHHTGAYRWILDRGIPRFGADGTFQGYIGCCVDIDDQKRARKTEI
jgi:PAS domain S-box-containing protein